VRGDVRLRVAFDRSRKVAEGRVAGVHFLMKKNKITEIHGYGSFTDDHTLEVKLNEGGTETVTFDNIIIATGSSTRLVPGTSLSANVVTYEELILSRELPKSIVIAGAGAIGMEFGYVLKNYGVDVTIVEFLPRALPNEDAEVSQGDREAVQEARREGADRNEGRVDQRWRRRRHRHGQQGRQDRADHGRQGAGRPSASRRTSRATVWTKPG